jgi:hypothetical protein
MENLRSRLISHSEKVKKLEEMEAALAGVFDQEAQANRERFEELVKQTIKPAFDEFKNTWRDLGRDAVITMNLTHNSCACNIRQTSRAEKTPNLGMGHFEFSDFGASGERALDFLGAGCL